MLATQSFFQDNPYNPNIDKPGFSLYDTDSYTSLLIHSDTTNGSTSFVDSSGNSLTCTGSGGITHSTAQAKLGASSMVLDGSDDIITVQAHASLFDVADGDFTVDFWIRPASGMITTTSATWFFSGTQDQNLSMAYSHGSTQSLEAWASTNGSSWNIVGDAGTNVWGTNNSLTANAWQHLALVRSGNLWKIFRNGTQEASVSSSGTVTDEMQNGLTIGQHGGGAYRVEGYIDEFRFSKGIARWTSNFTVY
jgi:hypothetical protein